MEARLITRAGMRDRNWALWATFCQVHRLNCAHFVVIDASCRILRGLFTSVVTSVQLLPWTPKPFLCRSTRQSWISFWVAGQTVKNNPQIKSLARFLQRALSCRLPEILRTSCTSFIMLSLDSEVLMEPQRSNLSRLGDNELRIAQME